MVGEGRVSTPWQNDFCGNIIANLLGKANRGGQASVKIQLKAVRTEGHKFEPQPEPSNIARPRSLYCNGIVYLLNTHLKNLLKNAISP